MWWVCRSVYGNSIADHLEYFGVHLQAESWGSCRIVMVDRSMIKDNVDLNGNFALSRDPTTSVVKLSTEMDTGHRSAAWKHVLSWKFRYQVLCLDPWGEHWKYYLSGFWWRNPTVHHSLYSIQCATNVIIITSIQSTVILDVNVNLVFWVVEVFSFALWWWWTIACKI